MLINLSEVFTCEGKKKTYEAELEMDSFVTAQSAYEITEKSPVVITVTNLGDRKLLLEIETKMTLSIPCARCLEPVAYSCELEFDRSADMNESDDDRVEELDEQPYLYGYNLDVDQLVCNELLLSLPMKVLCREDCKGICNRCGTNLNYGTCDCDTRALDPRMSVIQDIFNQFKEV